MARMAAIVCAVVFVMLALLAARHDGSALRGPDTRIEREAEEVRTPWLNRVVKGVTDLGAGAVLFPAGLVSAGLAWRRSRPLAVAVVVALLARPIIETSLKELIDRPRPDLAPLVRGRGRSFPSGHALGAVSLWGMVPAVVACYTSRRRLRVASVVVSIVMIVAIGASRVYLGVHWPTDVLGSFLIGATGIYLLHRLVEALTTDESTRPRTSVARR